MRINGKQRWRTEVQALLMCHCLNSERYLIVIVQMVNLLLATAASGALVNGNLRLPYLTLQCSDGDYNSQEQDRKTDPQAVLYQ